MTAEVPADALGEEWKGYVVRISGGNDKQGFPMKQGVLTHGRVRLLLSKGHSCYRPRRTGERKRKSVRGCIVDANLSVLNLVIIKKGEKDIPGLTDHTVPRRLGPKRASRIRKLFNLSKEDDVRQYVVRRPLNKEGKKPRTKAPKIQRLVTPRVLQHKRRRIALKKQRTQKNKEEAAEYAKLLAKRMKEAKEKRQEQIAKRRRLSSLRASTSKSESSQTKQRARGDRAGHGREETAGSGRLRSIAGLSDPSPLFRLEISVQLYGHKGLRPGSPLSDMATSLSGLGGARTGKMRSC